MIDFNKRPKLWTFLVSFVLSGAILWPTPYNDIALIQPAFFWKWLVLIAIVSFVAAVKTKILFLQNVIFSALGFPAAMFARVIVEGTLNPGTHNLWPLAMIISFFIGLAGAAMGGSIGQVIRKKN